MPIYTGASAGFIPCGGSARPGRFVSTGPPAIPTGLVVVSVTDTTITLDWNDSGDLRPGDKYQVYLNDVLLSPESTISSYTISTGLAAGTTYGVRVSAGQAGSYGDWTASVPARTTGGGGGGTAVNRPANPALIAYTNSVSTTYAANWAHPGAMIICRDNYTEPWVYTCASGGATVLIYLDTLAWNAGINRYSGLLYNASEFGGAVPLWPGPLDAGYGNFVADFRTTSILQTKLPGVIDKLVSENPHVSGIFLDDLGTRSWFSGFSWDSLTNTAKEQWRNGAIQIAQTCRSKADQHNLFLIANGFWGPITTTNAGDGGYPNRALAGCSLVDGGGVEQHDPSAPEFWDIYAAKNTSEGGTSQWGLATPRGLSYMFFMNTDPAQRAAWIAHTPSLVAFGHQGDYGTIYNPWGSFTDFGLPHR